MQASRSTRQAFTLASWFPPSHPMQIRFSDLQVLVFEESMCHTAPTTHCVSPVADHSTRLILLRHRTPPCCHPSTTHPAGGGALSQGPDRARRSAGPRASGDPPAPSGIWRHLLEAKGSFAEARGISVESACVVAWG